jgi:hypothetical protein
VIATPKHWKNAPDYDSALTMRDLINQTLLEGVMKKPTDGLENSRMTRRSFLLNASVVAASLALGRNLYASPSPAMNAPQIDASLRRKIGSLEVFPIGIGCMNAAWGFGDPMSLKDGARLFRAAADSGQHYFDTAEVYGAWLSEEMVGAALAPIRKDVIIASKFGFAINDQGNLTGLDSRPENIRKATEGSLKRLVSLN